MKKIRRFKFLITGLKSHHDGFQWTLGKWHKTECIELCHGFNCSEKTYLLFFQTGTSDQKNNSKVFRMIELTFACR